MMTAQKLATKMRQKASASDAGGAPQKKVLRARRTGLVASVAAAARAPRARVGAKVRGTHEGSF